MRSLWALPLVFLAACMGKAPLPDPHNSVPQVLGGAAPEGGWPIMGRLVGAIGGMPVAWEISDFSVGAYDGMAYLDSQEEGRVLGLIGVPPGQPEARTGRIKILAAVAYESPEDLHLGPVTVILADENMTRPVARSSGVVISLSEYHGLPAGESGYGRVALRVTGTLCAVEGGTCQPMDLRYSGDLQISG